MLRVISKFCKDESGATAIEYALLAGLIGVAIVVAVTLAGTNITAMFNAVAGALTIPAAT